MSDDDHTEDSPVTVNGAEADHPDLDTEAADVESSADEAPDIESTADEAADDDAQGQVSPEANGRRSRGKVGAWVGAVLLSLALVLSAGVAGWLYFYQYRPDQQTDAAAAKVALDAATSGTVALLSYSQTFYVLADDPAAGPMEAVRRSKQMMTNRRGKLFCLGLRYLCWSLLCLLTCGIGFLWLYPYMGVGYARFYDDLHPPAEAFQQAQASAFAAPQA